LTAFAAPSGPAVAQSSPKIMRIALDDINTLDPLFTTQVVENFLVQMTFDPLVRTLPDGTQIPCLAQTVPTLENGGISRDGKTITYHLRRGVRFSDGAPFTSADVLFTQRATIDPRNTSAHPESFRYVARVEAPDAFTVVEHLRAPYAPFVVQAFPAILPAHLLKGFADLNAADFNSHPIGTGPFVFDHWNRGDEIVYHRNPSYFRGPAALDGITIKFVPDQNSKLVALSTKAVDWVPFVSESPNARGMAAQPGLTWLGIPVNGFAGFLFNTTHPPLDDVRVRKAIQLAIDRPAILQKVYGNKFELATADLPSWSWAYDRTLAQPAHDPVKARALLASAGWVVGADGKARKGGKPLELTISTLSGFQTLAQIALLAQADLARVGIDLTIKPEASNVLFGRDAGSMFAGDFDLAFSSFTDQNDPDDSRAFACSSVPPHGFNVMRWCDASFDAATAIALSHYDRATRSRAYARTQRALLDGVPEVFVYWNVFSNVLRTNVRVSADGRSYLPPNEWTM
jgi:peptide/nickel transport system substrate-binding protein